MASLPDAVDEVLGVDLDVHKDVKAGHSGDVHWDEAGVAVVDEQICRAATRGFMSMSRCV